MFAVPWATLRPPQHVPRMFACQTQSTQSATRNSANAERGLVHGNLQAATASAKGVLQSYQMSVSVIMEERVP